MGANAILQDAAARVPPFGAKLVYAARSRDGPLQQQLGAQIGQSLSVAIISKDRDRLQACSKWVEQLGLGWEHVVPPNVSSMLVQDSVLYTKEAFNRTHKRPSSASISPGRHSLMLAHTAAVESCSSDWRLVLEDDAVPWVLPRDGRFPWADLLVQLSNTAFQHVPLVQMGVAPPYHRHAPPSGAGGLSMHLKNGSWQFGLSSCWGIGTHALLWRCSSAQETWWAAREDVGHPPNDVMIKLMIEKRFAQNGSRWPLCTSRSSLIQQNRGDFASTLGAGTIDVPNWASSRITRGVNGSVGTVQLYDYVKEMRQRTSQEDAAPTS